MLLNKLSQFTNGWVLENKLFFLVIQGGESRFDITRPGKICSDIGKIPLISKTECKEAATESGKSFEGEGNWGSYPKGCYLSSNIVYWNEKDPGSRNPRSQMICTKNGR